MQNRCLIRHPDSPAPSTNRVQVSASLDATGGLVLCYLLDGDPSQLRIPEPRELRREDGLWRHTCFEAFIMGGDAPAYREFNFSPSGAWQAYVFRGYRDGGLLEPAPVPLLNCRREAGKLILDCILPDYALPEAGTLRLGLSAVVEAGDGTLSYWALRHPPGKPDFHHTDGFVLSLDRP